MHAFEFGDLGADVGAPVDQRTVVRDFLLLAYAANTIYRFANPSRTRNVWEIVFWALGPPVWFLLEYFMLDHDWISMHDPAGKDAFLKSVKDYADYASKVWAAVLAAVLFLYTKKEQMENPIVRVFPHPPSLRRGSR